MNMPAGLVLRGAAGVEDRSALDGREAGEFEFLERGGRHCRDLPPPSERRWRYPTRLAKRSIGSDRGILVGEQLTSQAAEFSVGRAQLASHEGAESKGELT